MNKMRYGKKSCIAVWTVMIGMLCLCGCGDKVKKLQPQEWIMDGQVVSYYDNAEDIDENICHKYDFYMGGRMSDSPIWIVVNENNEIRHFCTKDSSIVTFKGICVGDEKSVVADAFSYEVDKGGLFEVYYDGETEINIEETDDVTEDMMMLAYIFEDDIVQEIWIYDMKFAKTFK